MKSRLFRLLSLLVLAACAAILVGAGNPNQSSKLQPINPMTITQGDIRITILHIAKVTSFSTQFVHGKEEGDGNTYAIPSIHLEILVEYLGSEEIKNHRTSSPIQLWCNGEKVTDREGVIGGGEYTIMQYGAMDKIYGFTLPPVQDESRTYLERKTLRGITISGSSVDIKIKHGFNEHEELFEFKNVPVY